jgi:hypothetical protein
MRAILLLLLLPLLSGCASDETSRGSDDAGNPVPDAPDGYRAGVVVVNEEFTVASGQPARFPVEFGPDARNVVLEIQQDSGAMPNLHVEVGGCGEVDPPASAGWQSYLVCERATAQETQVTISVNPGLPAGTGRFLLRADLPSP